MSSKKNSRKEKKIKSIRRRRERDRKDQHVINMFNEMHYENKVEHDMSADLEVIKESNNINQTNENRE